MRLPARDRPRPHPPARPLARLEPGAGAPQGEADAVWPSATDLVEVRRSVPTPPPFEDDPDGDNWHPADVEDDTTATCRRCGGHIVWEWDMVDPDNMGEPVVSTEHGWWYGPGGSQVCTPGADDTDRWHAPTTTPPPVVRAVTEEPYLAHYWSQDVPGGDAPWSVYREWYAHRDAPEPIDGSQEHVSTHPDEESAEAEARRLQAGGD